MEVLKKILKISQIEFSVVKTSSHDQKITEKSTKQILKNFPLHPQHVEINFLKTKN